MPAGHAPGHAHPLPRELFFIPLVAVVALIPSLLCHLTIPHHALGFRVTSALHNPTLANLGAWISAEGVDEKRRKG